MWPCMWGSFLTRCPGRFASVVFTSYLLFQRLAVPSTPIPLILPVLLLLVALALHNRLLVIHHTRFLLWLATMGAAGLLIYPQSIAVDGPIISPSSWAFLSLTLLPFSFSFRLTGEETFLATARALRTPTLTLSALSIVFVAVQLLGFPYVDIVARALPDSFLLSGFVTTYPFVYGTDLYRSNAWIGLEASFTSISLAVGLVALVYTRAPYWMLALATAAMATTASGSGMFVVALSACGMLATGRGHILARPAMLAALVIPILLTTGFGQALLERTTELGNRNSSSALRTTQPYSVLGGQWLTNPVAAYAGRGAGASQRIIEDQGVRGLVTPSPMKFVFDYGIFVGAGLCAILAVGCIGPLARGLPLGLGLSVLTLQTASIMLVTVIALLITWHGRQVTATLPRSI